ncbi:TIM barrel protein [Xylophilus sp. Kf1]|nr:TIM barrel protein [Xylophilus sp. Kf1]
MRRAIATVSLSGTLRQKLEAIAAARFDAVELFEADFVHFQGGAREVRRICADLGLGIDLYQPLRDFEGMPDAAHRRNLDRAERKFDLMGELNVSLMLVCSNVSPQSLGDAGLAAEQLHALADRAAGRGIRIGYEALAWGRWVKLYGQAWDRVRQADHPHLGLILDSFHTLSLRDDPAGIADIPGDRIFFVQMADAPLLSMDVLQWARHHRNFPGQGQLDVVGFYEQALRAGYTGTLSLEIFNDVFRGTSNRRTALDAMRSLLYLEAEVRARLEKAADDAASQRALQRLELFDPPQMPRPDGYAFVEFATDESRGAALGGLLERMGFQRVGRHRSKAVTLYRQGEARLIVNTQPDSHARERFGQQGATVCAMGITVDDPAAAASHATAFLSARQPTRRRPSELDLPAITAPGGTVVHFVGAGQDLAADFPADAAPPSTDCGVRGVDHLAMGLADDQFDTWTLFARTVLGLSFIESSELADPYGLIRSSGLRNDAASLRLVLNVSLGRHTRTARQVASTGPAGGSVHHIALACADIFSTVRTMRERGVGFVAISGNYYDDLAARLGLDENLVQRMRALDIVYDEAPAGTRYLQAFTVAFDDRFFFELVQRDAGYDSYGASNAPARLASLEQSRPG